MYVAEERRDIKMARVANVQPIIIVGGIKTTQTVRGKSLSSGVKTTRIALREPVDSGVKIIRTTDGSIIKNTKTE